MPSKKETQANRAEAINAALDSLAKEKGISKEAIVEALEESMEKAYIKYLGGGDDAVVECHLNTETGEIVLRQVKRVVRDVEDDYLEISEEDANDGLKKKKYVVGDNFYIDCPIDEVTKMTAMTVRNILRQRIAEAERGALYEIYKDHIGEMITGTVEKIDDRTLTVNIGRTVAELGRKAMIGEETYRVGDPIKVYLQEVKTAHPEEGKSRGPQIEVTRSSEGFLKRLFEEEIHEIYDGTVVIKKIAREAGVRSKVAVYSTNEDVDATGACIGQGGNRIQKVVSQLGNAPDKEKIDVINYSDWPAVFIAEALRPANVVGVALYEETNDQGQPKALAVVKDGQLSIAIGRKAANCRLASKLTGYSIDIKEEREAREQGLEYTSSEEWKAQEDAEKRQKEKDAFLRKRAEKLLQDDRRESAIERPTVTPKASAKEEEFPEEAFNPAAAALEEAKRQDEARKAAEIEASRPVEEEPVKPTEPTRVATTKSMEDLEAELNAAKEKKSQPAKKKPRKITEKEVERPTITPKVDLKESAPIYTEEELAAIKEEEEADSFEDFDEDIDYEDYDEYYDDEEGGRR